MDQEEKFDEFDEEEFKSYSYEIGLQKKLQDIHVPQKIRTTRLMSILRAQRVHHQIHNIHDKAHVPYGPLSSVEIAIQQHRKTVLEHRMSVLKTKQALTKGATMASTMTPAIRSLNRYLDVLVEKLSNPDCDVWSLELDLQEFNTGSDVDEGDNEDEEEDDASSESEETKKARAKAMAEAFVRMNPAFKRRESQVLKTMVGVSQTRRLSAMTGGGPTSSHRANSNTSNSNVAESRASYHPHLMDHVKVYRSSVMPIEVIHDGAAGKRHTAAAAKPHPPPHSLSHIQDGDGSSTRVAQSVDLSIPSGQLSTSSSTVSSGLTELLLLRTKKASPTSLSNPMGIVLNSSMLAPPSLRVPTAKLSMVLCSSIASGAEVEVTPAAPSSSSVVVSVVEDVQRDWSREMDLVSVARQASGMKTRRLRQAPTAQSRLKQSTSIALTNLVKDSKKGKVPAAKLLRFRGFIQSQLFRPNSRAEVGHRDSADIRGVQDDAGGGAFGQSTKGVDGDEAAGRAEDKREGEEEDRLAREERDDQNIQSKSINDAEQDEPVCEPEPEPEPELEPESDLSALVMTTQASSSSMSTMTDGSAVLRPVLRTPRMRHKGGRRKVAGRNLRRGDDRPQRGGAGGSAALPAVPRCAEVAQTYVASSLDSVLRLPTPTDHIHKQLAVLLPVTLTARSVPSRQRSFNRDVGPQRLTESPTLRPSSMTSATTLTDGRHAPVQVNSGDARGESVAVSSICPDHSPHHPPPPSSFSSSSVLASQTMSEPLPLSSLASLTFGARVPTPPSSPLPSMAFAAPRSLRSTPSSSSTSSPSPRKMKFLQSVTDIRTPKND